MKQLSLDLAPRRLPSRQQQVIERLRAVLTRQGIDWHYRATRGSVLLRPMLAVRFGWQPMCGRFCCGNIVFERAGYFERESLTPEERREWVRWQQEVWRSALYEMWGRP
jgi:hypothetical protein